MELTALIRPSVAAGRGRFGLEEEGQGKEREIWTDARGVLLSQGMNHKTS